MEECHKKFYGLEDKELRRLFKKYREAKKFDKHLYHQLYLDCKAARYNSKRKVADAVEKILAKKNWNKK